MYRCGDPPDASIRRRRAFAMMWGTEDQINAVPRLNSIMTIKDSNESRWSPPRGKCRAHCLLASRGRCNRPTPTRATATPPSSSAARRRRLRRHDNTQIHQFCRAVSLRNGRHIAAFNIVPYLCFLPPSLFECVAPPGNPKPFRKFGAAPRKLTYFACNAPHSSLHLDLVASSIRALTLYFSRIPV